MMPFLIIDIEKDDKDKNFKSKMREFTGVNLKVDYRLTSKAKCVWNEVVERLPMYTCAVVVQNVCNSNQQENSMRQRISIVVDSKQE